MSKLGDSKLLSMEQAFDVEAAAAQALGDHYGLPLGSLWEAVIKEPYGEFITALVDDRLHPGQADVEARLERYRIECRKFFNGKSKPGLNLAVHPFDRVERSLNIWLGAHVVPATGSQPA